MEFVQTMRLRLKGLGCQMSMTALGQDLLRSLMVFGADGNPAHAQIAYPILSELGYMQDQQDCAVMLWRAGIWRSYDDKRAVPMTVYPDVQSRHIYTNKTMADIQSKQSHQSELAITDQEDQDRFDFGNMNAYAIDDPSASEIDDAVSIDGDWVHVHVADPTAWVRPDSRLGSRVLQLVSNLYLAERTFSIMPSALVDRVSLLQSDSDSKSFRRTLTISCKLGQDGSIHEYRIRPSIIRSIHQLQYDTVDQLLKSSKTPSSHESIFVHENDPLADYYGRIVQKDVTMDGQQGSGDILFPIKTQLLYR
jgi:hypothetical protein